MPVEIFLSQMVIAISGNPKLMACTPASQFAAVHACATMALLPTLGQVALVPRNNKVGNQWVPQVTVVPQWQGFKSLMERHPDVREVVPFLVHVQDEFSFIPGDSGDVVIHRYDPLSDARTINGPEDIKGGYAKIYYKDGRPSKYHFATRAYIEQCRACSDGYRAYLEKKAEQTPWVNWFEQQALKTVLRSAFSRRAVPLDPFFTSKMQEALNQDDTILENRPLPNETAGAIEHRPIQSRTQRIAQQLRGAPDVGLVDSIPMDAPPADEPETVSSSSEQSNPEPRKSTARTGDLLDAVEQPAVSKPAKSGKVPPPEVPDCLVKFAQVVHQCQDEAALSGVAQVMPDYCEADNITPEIDKAAKELVAWKRSTLKGKK